MFANTPIYFVSRLRSRWGPLVDTPQPIGPDTVPDRFVRGEDAWILQSYMRLRQQRYNVRLVSHLVPDAICVIHYNELRLDQVGMRSFIVAVQPDRPRPYLCDMRIVQNPLAVRSRKRDLFIPLWPVPGLLKREVRRGRCFNRIAYFGHAYYLPSEFTSAGFRESLGKIGFEFVIRESNWFDYSDVDVALGIRNETGSYLVTKPASKLVNAWLVGCVPLMGPEPAYQSLRRSDLDYIEVRGTADVLDAVKRLIDQPDLFDQIIDNGRRRRVEHDVSAVLNQWEHCLERFIVPAYERWLRLPRTVRAARSLSSYPLDLTRHCLAKMTYRDRHWGYIRAAQRALFRKDLLQ